MSTATIATLDFIEQRTALLNALAEALSSASSSVIGFDLDGLEARIAQQQKLCLEISQLDQQIVAVQQRAAQATPVSASLPQAVSRLHEAQARVKFLNHQHQLLLQRSRRTVNALQRSYQTFAADLYDNPASTTHPPCASGENA